MKIKKYFNFALVAVVCGAMFMACNGKNEPQKVDPTEKDDTTEKCWEITTSYTGAGSATTYVWATEYVVALQVEGYNKTPGMSASYKEANAKDINSCSALNH